MAIQTRKYPPAGATLLECMMALALLATAFTLGAQALGWSAAQRRLGDQRHAALQEAANCLERVRQLNWDELHDERLAQMELSYQPPARIPSATLHVAAEPTDDPEAMKVQVEIQWLSRSGTPLQISLVTWRYKTGEVP
jgi:hypothetical protein